MNILHISSNYPPAIGGPASSIPYLVKELGKKGHGSMVLTRDAKGHPSFEILDGIRVYRSIRIPGEFYNPVVASAKALAMGYKTRRVIDREGVELIHCHDMNVSAIAGMLGSRFKDVKKVVKFPGDLAWEFLSLTRFSDEYPEELLQSGRTLVRLLHWMQDRLCNYFDTIIAPSHYMKESLLKYSKVERSKVSVVYNGVAVQPYSDEEVMRLRKDLLKDSKHLVINASRMVPWKGLDYLIEAFEKLPKDIRLALIGDGPWRKRLEMKSAGLNVEFVGKVPYSEIQKYLRASDVFVLPSIYEPSALALLDCLVTQTPVIATDVGGTPELIEDGKTGLLIPSRDVEAIIENIKRIINDDALRLRIKRNQLESSKGFLWEIRIRDYVDVYMALK